MLLVFVGVTCELAYGVVFVLAVVPQLLLYERVLILTVDAVRTPATLFM